MTSPGKIPRVKVTKASGALAWFSMKKLRRSLRKAGADLKQIDRISAEIRPLLVDGITTRKIYGHAFALLKRLAAPGVAGRYKLKKAILEFGPTGFPFEVFVSELLMAQGYQVEVGKVFEGRCVRHEVDVSALKDDQHFMIECKFHNRQGYKSDVKVPLYIYARFLDVESRWKQLPGHAEKVHVAWVVTNTRFTTDAIRYGQCAGLHLIGWDAPKDEGLKDMIDRYGLHPVTCMTTLQKREKQLLLEKGIVLCRRLCERPVLLEEVGINPVRHRRILEEGAKICALDMQRHSA